MISAAAYKNPHHVMLFFEEKEMSEGIKCAEARANYYDCLKNEGKVLMSGSFWNQARNFVIVHVSSDAELLRIIDNDPAIVQNTVELVRAMPF